MTNNSGRDHRMVEFLISVYDKNGKLIDTDFILFSKFAKGDTKSFKQIFISRLVARHQIASYKIQFDD